MRTQPLVFVCVVVLAALSVHAGSASAQYAFRADFEDGVVGMAPPTSPAGEPDGDAFQVSNSTPGSITIADDIAGMDGNAVLMDRDLGPGTFAVHCLLAPEAGDPTVFELRWRSVALSQQFLLSMTLRAGPYLMGSVQYRREGEITWASSQYTLDVTWQQGVPQDFVLQVDLDKGITRLFVDDVEVALPFSLSAVSKPLDRIGFEMGGQGFDDFAIDNVELEILDSIVPTQPSSWGALKGSYAPR